MALQLLQRSRVSALLALLAVWSLLLAAPLLAPWTGAPAATLVAQALAVLLMLGTRQRSATSRPPSAARLALGMAAGYASFPAFVFATVVAGLALGLQPRGSVPAWSGSPALWACALVTAPIFEELLYRQRLLDALRGWLGSGLAVAATSGLFAVSHLEPWHMVATFLVGLGLGALRIFGAGVELCIAAHLGLNLASLVGGSPPQRWALDPLAGAAVALGAAALALVTRARLLPADDRSPALPRPGAARG